MTRSWMLHAAAVMTMAAVLSAQDKTPPTVDSVLRAAGQYLAQYERTVSGIVAEESYLQRIPGEAQSRWLRSDTLVILDPGLGWVSFRDVFEVNGQKVRDRDERLANLFLHPKPDAFAQARRIVDEGSRFNLNPPEAGINRTINQPFMALKFLRAANQARSVFNIDRRLASERAGSILLTFVEKAKPRLIASPDNAAAQGSFRLDPASGRVSESELRIQTGATRITIRVTYAEQPALNLLLPDSMDESYAMPSLGIVGHATYSKFRQFTVETDTIVK